MEFIAQLPQLPSKPSDLRTPSFYTINAGRALNKGKDLNTQIRWEFYKALEVWANRYDKSYLYYYNYFS